MLKQRVITALVLLAVLLPALLNTNVQYFMGLSLLMISAGAWEWGRLNGRSHVESVVGAVLFFLLSVMLVDGGWDRRVPSALWLVSGAAWVLLGVGMLRVGVAGWGRLPSHLRWLAGLGFLAVAWLALIQAHRIGVNFLLSVLVLVWAADVLAYFAGRAWGGRVFRFKLAPSISPGKTWEGVAGGLVGNVVATLIAHFTFFPELPLVHAVPLALVMGVLGITGDLCESMIKRGAKAKDAGALIPGHGGLLDRLDSMLFNAPVIYYYAVCFLN